MGSVHDLGRWLYSRGNADKNHASSPMNIRLDLTSEQELARMAERFGMAKATLAQELLRAAIQDVRRIGYEPADFDGFDEPLRSGDVLTQDELDEAGLSGNEIVQSSHLDHQGRHHSELQEER